MFTGDGGAFSYARVPLPTGVRIVKGLWGNAAGAVFARGFGSSGSAILVLDGGAFSIVASDYSGGTGSLRVTPSGAAYVTTDTGVLACASNCTSAAAWGVASLFPANQEILISVCLQGERPFFVGAGPGREVAVHVPSASAPWTWTRRVVGLNPSSSHAGGCAVDEDGTVLVAMEGGVGALGASGAVLPVVGASGGLWWHDVLVQGGRAVVAGDGKSIGERQADGGWVATTALSSDGNHLQCLAGRDPRELFAFGFHGTAGQNGGISRAWGSWTFGSLSYFDIYAAWAASDNTHFIAGQELNSIGGVVGGFVFVGTR